MKIHQNLNPNRTIIVLTDFTRSAINAADYALFLATELQTDILLFHSSYISSSQFESSQITDYASLHQNSLLNLQKETNRLKDVSKASGVDYKPGIEYLSESGSLAENISSIIDERKNILMIVMSGFKANNNDDFLFGTEITAIVSKARCPAVIVPEVDFLRL